MEKYRDKTLSADERAKDLVSKMTLEEKASQLRYDAPEIARLGVPSYNWWNEGLHGVARAGVATMFPQAIALAAMFDDDTLYKVADVISTEARAKYNVAIKEGDRDIYKGLTLWSPNINIFRDPRWGRIIESVGEDPYLAQNVAKAVIGGFQGDDYSKDGKLCACAKHFVGYGASEGGRDYNRTEISEYTLRNFHLKFMVFF